MNQLKLLTILLFGLVYTTEAQIMLDPTTLNGKLIKPALLYWDFGSPEYLTIESIYPTKDSSKQYWNVTHRSPNPDVKSGNGFDFYKIDQATLKPTLSHMYHDGFTNYKIAFHQDSATIHIQNATDTVKYYLSLPKYTAPEGPGNSVFVASLPLRENYHIRYQELNRWSGEQPNTGEIQLTELKVTGTDVINIDGKAYETYQLTITNEKNRLTEVWALKESPHYPVKIYHRIDDNRTMRSKVVKLLLLDS